MVTNNSSIFSEDLQRWPMRDNKPPVERHHSLGKRMRGGWQREVGKAVGSVTVKQWPHSMLAASTRAPCARESIALTHSTPSKEGWQCARMVWVVPGSLPSKRVGKKVGGNSNNPEVFSRSPLPILHTYPHLSHPIPLSLSPPYGQVVSQDTAKTVRVL